MMKILFLVCSISLLCLCSYKHPSLSNPPKWTTISEPTVIKLVDSKNAVTIECTKSGNKWVVTNTAQAAAYLKAVAEKTFKVSNLSTVQNMEVDFDSLYTIGALVGMGSWENGPNFPIGIQYERTTNPPGYPAGLVTMGASEIHSCTGAPCECCDFLKDKGKINGCQCVEKHLCIKQSGDRCNHTVTTAQ